MPRRSPAFLRLLALFAAIGAGLALWSHTLEVPRARAAHAPSAHAAAERQAPSTATARSEAFPRGCPTNAVLQLAGTALIDGGRRIALVRTPTTSRLVTEGQTVAGHTVRAIARRQVAVTKGALRTCLKRQRAQSTPATRAARLGSVRSTGPGRYAIERAWLKRQLADIAPLRDDIRMRPHRRNGQLQGFRVARIREGGVFARLGLKKGDVVRAANGQPLDSPNRVLKLYGQLPDADVVRLRIERDGVSRTLDYEID